MVSILSQLEQQGSLAELLDQLGGIPAHRVRRDPPPGQANEQDVVRIEASESRLCELVDGTLVEKAMGYAESFLAAFIVTLLRNFVDPRNLGLVTGADGMVRLFPGMVRIPDAAFISWARVPGGRLPREPVPALIPDLAVEVLSETNTADEMRRKVRDYSAAGVRRYWEVDPRARTVTVFISPDQKTVLDASATLDGGDVLPGFSTSLAELFSELDRTGQAAPGT